MHTSTCRGPLRGSAENDEGGHTRSIEGIQDAACSHFGNERVIESIFVTAWHSRQTFPSNIRLKVFSQSVEPDALLQFVSVPPRLRGATPPSDTSARSRWS